MLFHLLFIAHRTGLNLARRINVIDLTPNQGSGERSRFLPINISFVSHDLKGLPKLPPLFLLKVQIVDIPYWGFTQTLLWSIHASWVLNQCPYELCNYWHEWCFLKVLHCLKCRLIPSARSSMEGKSAIGSFI